MFEALRRFKLYGIWLSLGIEVEGGGVAVVVGGGIVLASESEPGPRVTTGKYRIWTEDVE